MRRRILPVSAGACLLAALAIGAAWFRSGDDLGGLSFSTPGTVRPATPAENLKAGYRFTTWTCSFAGLRLANEVAFLHHDDHVRNGNVVDMLDVAIPFWMLLVASGIVPFAWLARRRRSRLAALRGEAGLCVKCGYDLRASGERCPECGAGITAEAAA